MHSCETEEAEEEEDGGGDVVTFVDDILGVGDRFIPVFFSGKYIQVFFVVVVVLLLLLLLPVLPIALAIIGAK